MTDPSLTSLPARSSRPVCIARTSTNAGHILAVCAAAHGEVLTFKATKDGQAVRALSVAFEGRKPISDGTVSAIAARLVNDLEGYDRDAMETFADALAGQSPPHRGGAFPALPCFFPGYAPPCTNYRPQLFFEIPNYRLKRIFQIP